MGRNESNETVWDRTDQDEERECDGEWKKVRVDEEFVRIPIAVRFARGEEDERMFISIPSGEGGVCFSRNPVYSAKKAGEKFGRDSRNALYLRRNFTKLTKIRRYEQIHFHRYKTDTEAPEGESGRPAEAKKLKVNQESHLPVTYK